jgi:hypothetical protein
MPAVDRPDDPGNYDYEPAPPPSDPPARQQQAPTPRGPYAPGPQPHVASAPAAPTDHTWDGIPSGYHTELEDLALQWQQIAGFSVTIDEAALRKMADAHVVSLRDLGQWMWGTQGAMSGDLKQRSPWLAFGMDQTSFQRQLSDYQDTYQQLTGQRLDFSMDASTNPSIGWVWQAFSQNLTQSGLREQFLHDQNMLNTYGWLKFGLDFDTFQQRKVDMRVSFGQDLTNDQAILQLQYQHQAQGSSRAVTAPAPQGQQAGPVTPTEVEVR